MGKFAIDCLVIITAAYGSLPSTVAAHGGVSPIGNGARILWLLRDAATTYADYALQVVGFHGVLTGALLALAVALWLVLQRRSPPQGVPLLAGMAALVMLLVVLPATWLPLVFANDWYRPGLLGVGNRINAVGDVIVATAIGLALSLLGQALARVSRTQVLGAMASAGIAGAIIAPMISRSLSDASIYAAAGQRATNIQSLMRDLVPRPQHGDFFMLTNYNIYQGRVWVPVLAASWDVTGAVRLTYHDGSLSGAPLGAPACSTGVVAGHAYRTVHVIDVDGRRIVHVIDKKTCDATLPKLMTKPYPA
jgi:hypothetical protein